MWFKNDPKSKLLFSIEKLIITTRGFLFIAAPVQPSPGEVKKLEN